MSQCERCSADTEGYDICYNCGLWCQRCEILISKQRMFPCSECGIESCIDCWALDCCRQVCKSCFEKDDSIGFKCETCDIIHCSECNVCSTCTNTVCIKTRSSCYLHRYCTSCSEENICKMCNTSICSLCQHDEHTPDKCHVLSCSKCLAWGFLVENCKNTHCAECFMKTNRKGHCSLCRIEFVSHLVSGPPIFPSPLVSLIADYVCGTTNMED